MKKKNLLIVDDDEVIVFLLKKLFEKKFTVFAADDGVEAIQHLSQGIVPDLVITDILMENINGYEFIEHLRTSNVYKNVPVVVLSNVSGEELVSRAPHLKVIKKPFDPIHLKNIVEELVSINYDISRMQ